MVRTKQTPKVSILIPCYNVERYLPQCLDSVVNQSLKDIEIICINDGSTDKTLNIIKQYAKKDSRIKIVNQKNGGLGRAYNSGLATATGKYIAIVESDDWVETDAFEYLYNVAIKNRADIVKADYVFFDSKTKTEYPGWLMEIAKDKQGRVFCPSEQNPDIIWSGHPSIWTCLYSRQMLVDNNIRFAEIPGAAFQDMGFKVKTFVVSTRFIYIPKVVLHYRQHANNSDKNNGKVFAVSEVHDEVDKWLLENRSDLQNLSKILNQCRFANYVWNFRRLSGQSKRDFRRRFISEFKRCYSSGALERLYCDDKLWLKLYCIVYPYNPLWKVLRTIVTIISPIYKTRVRMGYKIYYLFNKFAVKKIQLPGFMHK